MAERRGKKSKSVPKLSAEAKADVMEAFHLFAHDDEVSASQLRLVLQALGIVVTEEESETLLSAHDPDGTEALGADAVVTVYQEQLALRDKDAEVDQAWQIFDVEGRGFITKEDLQRVVREIGEKFDDDELEDMIDLACAEGGDEHVTREAFAQLMKSL